MFDSISKSNVCIVVSAPLARRRSDYAIAAGRRIRLAYVRFINGIIMDRFYYISRGDLENEVIKSFI